MSRNTQILPSILAADFGKLAAEAERAVEAGADALHVDIMDGHFVPNLSMGPDVVAMCRRTVDVPLNVHLMMDNPYAMADAFMDAGADDLLIHVEPDYDIVGLLSSIRDRGVRPGITLNPDTPAEAGYPYLELVDEVLCMSVHPGYGGQSFIPDVLPKIRQLRDRIDAGGLDCDIMVDGGINPETAGLCAAQGANKFVAGSALFRAEDMAGEIGKMRREVARAVS